MIGLPMWPIDNEAPYTNDEIAKGRAGLDRALVNADAFVVEHPDLEVSEIIRKLSANIRASMEKE